MNPLCLRGDDLEGQTPRIVYRLLKKSKMDERCQNFLGEPLSGDFTSQLCLLNKRN